MDEVLLTFDCPPNCTVDTCGVKTVSITTTDQEKTHFTVILACCADGTKLKLLLIFKRKTIPKENFPRSVIILCNEVVIWCNKDIMLDWFQEVLKKREGGLTKILQPLDISVNRSFKSNVRACWENWMLEGLHTCTKGGNMRHASYTDVAGCVDKSWKSVKVSTIRSGFIKAGIVSESEEITDSEDSDAENELLDTLPENILELFNSDTAR
ncbi:pogo transposable element with KRAB domain [Trichonephila clavipes]|uniref:Pogo transposable element with KRAB domain n=1 Tax=Trichonephila clavipes TaxID=2585209 RepID=A0A8X6VCQ4_TRICX|nr:pogo transposable element with KRAB domain [Trichonephila clavipes]